MYKSLLPSYDLRHSWRGCSPFTSMVLVLVTLWTAICCAVQMNEKWTEYVLFPRESLSYFKLEQVDMMLFSSLVLRMATSLTSFATIAPEVTLGNTTLYGSNILASGHAQDFFGGIPFAEPPLGELRLQPPVLKTSLAVSTFDASNFGLGCLQPNTPVDSISEDCLTVNILRPAGISSNASLPVMAWIYGGGFFGGAASSYNGSAIVAQSATRGTPVIYVNFNYRLGPLGFPQGREAADRMALNLGLKDQLAALEWIQTNIGAFGGDKSKVTIFGESAGAVSLGVLLLNPDISKLARAAIFESGSAATTLTYHAGRRQVDWDNFVSNVASCETYAMSPDTFTCLQEATSSELLQGLVSVIAASSEQFPYPPTLDGPGGVYPELPSKMFAQGMFARIPFIAGTNLDEGTMFIPTSVNSTKLIHDWLIANFTPSLVGSHELEEATHKILELYPDVPACGSPFGTGNQTFGLSSQFKRFAAIMDDILFQSQRRIWIQTASNAGVKTYGYLFTQPQPQLPAYLGVEHSSELAYIYGSVNSPSSAQILSQNMIDYWISFAASLDPNDGLGTQRPSWTQYTPENQMLLQLDGTNTTLVPDTYRAEQINFINSNPLLFHH